jgi:alginate O-acetyltransferase complex protein AlgI
MVFSSLIFIIAFFPTVLFFYFISKNKFRNFVILIFSLIFYAWGEPVYIVLMLFSSIVDYTNGRMIEKFQNRKYLPKLFLVLSICINLFLLGYFKYSGFLIENINNLLNTQIATKDLRLPIGISFYTFQTMSYSIDVYRKKVKAEHNLLNFMTYVSMFPQLIAGPIVRYSSIQQELNNRVITKENVMSGTIRIIQGLAKKVLLANSIGLLATTIINSDFSTMSSLTAWLGAIAFAFQIYFDFSGYSDMAIGMGKVFGFSYPENFNYPYTCDSIKSFWQRWHMSLTVWFRDYVYFPIGGNRKGIARTIINILIVWALTGMWHGAAWNFILWGMYFGILLIIEKFVIHKLLDFLPSILKRLYALLIILIGWVIFMLESPTEIHSYIRAMFSFENIIDNQFKYMISNYLIIIILCALFCVPIKRIIQSKIKLNFSKHVYESVYMLFYLFIFVFSIVFIVDNTFNPFLYFRF